MADDVWLGKWIVLSGVDVGEKPGGGGVIFNAAGGSNEFVLIPAEFAGKTKAYVVTSASNGLPPYWSGCVFYAGGSAQPATTPSSRRVDAKASNFSELLHKKVISANGATDYAKQKRLVGVIMVNGNPEWLVLHRIPKLVKDTDGSLQDGLRIDVVDPTVQTSGKSASIAGKGNENGTGGGVKGH